MTDETQSKVDVDLSGYVEPEIIEDLDHVYTLQVVNMDVREVSTKNGPATVVDVVNRVADSGLTNPKMVRYSLWMPKASDSADRQNAAKGRILRFKKACGMSDEEARTGGLDADELVGCEFQARLGVEKSDEYGDKNTIKRVVVD